MENASKALIIAGSILLAVLIVAFGVTIFNRARSSAGTEVLDSTEITMFNSTFEKYITTGQDTIIGSQVKTLLSSLISNSTTYKEESIKLPTVRADLSASSISVQPAQGGQNAVNNNTGYRNALSTIRSSITNKKDYTVVVVTYSDDGLIEEILITELP